MDKKESKYQVHVRALKVRIFNPKLGRIETVKRGYVFKNPWPELIKLATGDKNHHIFALVKIEKKAEEIKHVHK